MRGLRAAAFAFGVAFLLSGCVGEAADKEPAAGCIDCNEDAGSDDPVLQTSDEVAAPELVVGTKWTYKMSGPWAFHDRFDVVLAKADADGYLFAGATTSDLTQAILEGSAVLGPTDRHLSPLHEGKPYRQPFAFPLHDGKAWSFEGTDWTATAADVPTPEGVMPGFRIVGMNADLVWEYTYAPALGAITGHTFTIGPRGVLWSLELEAIGTATTWAWFDYAFWTGIDEPKVEHHTIDEAVDAMLFESYGAAGARGFAKPPTGEPLQFEGKGEEEWQIAVVDAEPGIWVMGAVVPPEQQYVLWAIGVTWQGGTLE